MIEMNSRMRLSSLCVVCLVVSANAAIGCGSSNEGAGTKDNNRSSSAAGGNSPATSSSSSASPGGSSPASSSSIPPASGGSGATNQSPASTVQAVERGGSTAAGGTNGLLGTPGSSSKSSSGGGPAIGGRAAIAGAPSTGGRPGITSSTRAGGGRSGGGTSGLSVGFGGAQLSPGGSTSSPPSGDDCAIGAWPTSDPAAAGPFATVTENNVGPEAGVGAAGAAGAPQFTMFRPKDMAQGGLCHPVVTWGNGTSANPSMYKVLLNNLASHGFVVIASNSPNVAKGTPAPMIVGIDWVLAQNDDPASALYHRIDKTHIGATGHSQGAMATSQASSDARIVASVPIEGASTQRNLHGPAMFFCGGLDDTVGCTGSENALNAVTTLPAMYAEYLSVDHGSWMSFMGTKPSVVESVVTAWMRVHLMGDTELRSWFYGASCKLCTDSGWKIMQKNMDQ